MAALSIPSPARPPESKALRLEAEPTAAAVAAVPEAASGAGVAEGMSEEPAVNDGTLSKRERARARRKFAQLDIDDSQTLEGEELTALAECVSSIHPPCPPPTSHSGPRRDHWAATSWERGAGAQRGGRRCVRGSRWVFSRFHPDSDTMSEAQRVALWRQIVQRTGEGPMDFEAFAAWCAPPAQWPAACPWFSPVPVLQSAHAAAASGRSERGATRLRYA